MNYFVLLATIIAVWDAFGYLLALNTNNNKDSRQVQRRRIEGKVIDVLLNGSHVAMVIKAKASAKATGIDLNQNKIPLPVSTPASDPPLAPAAFSPLTVPSPAPCPVPAQVPPPPAASSISSSSKAAENVQSTGNIVPPPPAASSTSSSSKAAENVQSTGNPVPPPPAASSISSSSKAAENVQSTGNIETPSSLDEFREKILRESNNKRKLHGASPLFLTAELNDAAQAFAKELANEKAFRHSDPNSRPNEGENVYQECFSHFIPTDNSRVVEAFYSEKEKYDPNNPLDVQAAGHFTQLVWKSTTNLGVGEGKFINEDGLTCYNVVCRYSPPGNIPTLEAYHENVQV